VKLTAHIHLVPRSRIRVAITLFPNTPSWRGAQLKKEIPGTTLPFSMCNVLQGSDAELVFVAMHLDLL